jgi:hypothetical protein
VEKNMALFYFSTSPYLKYFFNEKFYKNKHYVWCSEVFNSHDSAKISAAGHIPASSNPYDIYNELKNAVIKPDRHSSKIKELKTSMTAVALEKLKAGEISDKEKDEIIYSIGNADMEYWNPVLYIIPIDRISSRAITVPVEKRASIAGPEYIIPDLLPSEFEIIQF